MLIHIEAVSMAEASNNATISMTNLTLPLLKGENYKFWIIKMRTMLKSHGLWELIEVGAPNPDPTLIKTNKRDAKAMFFIQQVIHESVFAKITTVERTKEA
jgi:starvation-inducible outer membrane lipoprotein